MTLATAYLAGLGTMAALRWLRWRHIRTAWWLVRNVPAIVACALEAPW